MVAYPDKCKIPKNRHAYKTTYTTATLMCTIQQEVLYHAHDKPNSMEWSMPLVVCY